jgi:hypothetical protein
VRTVFCKRLFTAHFARTLDPRRFFASSPSCSSASAADATPPLTQHAQASPSASLRSGVSDGFAAGPLRHLRRLHFVQAPPVASLKTVQARHTTASLKTAAGASVTRRLPLTTVHAPRLLDGFTPIGFMSPASTPLRFRRSKPAASVRLGYSLASAPFAFRSPRILVGFRRSNANAQVAEPFGFTSFRSQVSLASLCLLGLLASLYAGDQLPDSLPAPQLSQIECIALRLPLGISYSG